MKQLIKHPIMLAQALFYLNAGIWLSFGITSLLRLASQNPDMASTMFFIGIMMFGNAAAMLAAGWMLQKKQRPFYIFALVVLLTNILLTFTDQFGIFDLATLIIDLVLIGLMLIKRKFFIA